MGSRAGAEHYVYRIKHQDCSDDIVDVVLDILDGPQPMRDFKPAELTPNSADQFWQCHQAEHEARGKASGGHIHRVHQHNTAYPLLRDELDKRRSLAEVPAVHAKRSLCLDHKGSASSKLKGARDTQRLKLKSRHRWQSVPKSKCKCRENRIRKRSRLRGSRIKFITNSSNVSVANKSCQYRWCVAVFDKNTGSNNLIYQKSAPNVNSSTSSNVIVLKNKSVAVTDKKLNLTVNARESCANDAQKSKSNDSKQSKSEAVSQNPDTSEPSITSYNSFMSMDHEPMVSP